MTFTLFTSTLFLMIYRVNISYSEMQPYIVGGQNAVINQFPYSAHLGIECKSDLESNAWICGGSIINQNLVLTAGHCLDPCSKQTKISASFGHENILYASTASIRSFVVHHHYSETTGAGDIALTRLNSELTFDSRVNRIALMGRPPYREEAMVAGWGVIDDIKETHTKTLQFTKQYVWERKDCTDLLQILPKGTICARSNDNSYPSAGDSGSALVVRGYMQIGLVSHKLPVSSSVIIYTDTGYYYKWIKAVSNKIMCQ